MRRGIIAIFVALLCSNPAAAKVAAGALDPKFDGDGKLVADFGGVGGAVYALALQRDGKIVATGPIGRVFNVMRYNANGSVDTKFSPNRVPPFVYGTAYAIALQRDGKIIVAGAMWDRYARFATVRYTKDGKLDQTFGTGGVVVVDFGNRGAEIRAVAVQPDGKIVVAGFASFGQAAEDVVLIRYLPGGLVDGSFGSGGMVTSDLSEGQADIASGLVIQPDRKLLVNSARFLVRYLPNGSPDTSFGVGGKVANPFWTTAFALQRDGRIVIAGADYSVTPARFAVGRYSSTGALDTKFGSGGVNTVKMGPGDETANGVAIQKDGRIVLAGRSGDSGDNADFALARFRPDGALDPTFGAAGKVITDFGGDQDEAYAIAVQKDGKILAAGGGAASGGSVSFAIARYLGR